jgi:hypothetical protein
MNKKIPLPPGTTLGLSFEYGIDINIGTFDVPLWQSCRRISGFTKTPRPVMQDAQTYDDFGNPNSAVASWGIDIAFTIQVNRSLTTGLYLPEVEWINARAGMNPEAVADLALLEARWYHKPLLGKANPGDAGQGLFTVGAPRVNTGPGGEVEALGIALTGQSTYEQIANPWIGYSDTTDPEE